jgi:hypothetical protein
MRSAVLMWACWAPIRKPDVHKYVQANRWLGRGSVRMSAVGGFLTDRFQASMRRLRTIASRPELAVSSLSVTERATRQSGRCLWLAIRQLSTQLGYRLVHRTIPEAEFRRQPG